MSHRLPDSDTTTQVVHPHRAVVRSSLATTVAVVPILWPLVNRELGAVWATVAVVAAVAGNAVVTRLLTYPGVEAWLRDVLPQLAASPPDEQSRPARGRLDLAAPLPAMMASDTGELLQLDGAAGDLLASESERVVSGLVIPWNQQGATTAGALTIPPGAVRVPRDIGRVKLLFKHTGTEGHKPVGRALSYEPKADGLHMSFAIARTPDGDAAIDQVREGVFDAFSAELRAVKKNATTVQDSILTGVALVDRPAFDDARVHNLNAEYTHITQEHDTMNVKDFIHAMMAAGATEQAARAKAAEYFDAADIAAVAIDPAAANRPAESAPAAPAAEQAPAAPAVAHAGYTPATPPVVPAALTEHRSPTIVHASAYEAAQTILAASRDRSQVVHAALSDITNSGLTDAIPPAWLGQLWSGPAKQRELVPLLNQKPLRSWRMQGFRWKDKPLVAAYTGDKTEIPSGPVSVEPYESEATRWAGGHDLDRKFWDFGDAGILADYWAMMNESYAVVTDQAAGAFIVANAKTVAPLAPVGEIPALVLAMYQAKNSVKKATGVLPSYYLANSADQLKLLELTAQNKPAFWDQLGVDPSMILWRDHVPAGTLVAGAKPATTFWELPGSPLRVEAEHLSHGGRDRAMFGYTGQTVDNPDGLVKIAFTVTP
ncbi:capsid and capsid maturation protease [Gordonia phage Jeanie]|uniref:Capsid and capsid maturation protease n=2 Tax=root TaxID=1 RepID=A0A160DHH2_9CAUD|nr:hypothetical protein [Gordonia neofelifaecis]YP_009274019.1 major head protein [Gordonia phage McGonagall]ANA87585.1 capsid and capsid maturation protease [Gordonia phage McGonagall]ANA87612.1 capsid and capsid maturation protease [Gordonia phage Jeanie]EGD53218.1 hypothetical protein SCNU_20062 [Gordonia neofelifaecis NRRL B-59395]